jgi:hypothetical protein
MWGLVDLVWTDVSEERIASIFRVETSASEEPAWAGGCRLSHLKSYKNISDKNICFTFVTSTQNIFSSMYISRDTSRNACSSSCKAVVRNVQFKLKIVQVQQIAFHTILQYEISLIFLAAVLLSTLCKNYIINCSWLIDLSIRLILTFSSRLLLKQVNCLTVKEVINS